MTAPPRRVRVTSPRTSAARTRPAGTGADPGLDTASRLGEVYVSSLLRAQLRLGLGVLSVVVGVLGGLPLVFAVAPRLTRVEVLGMPLPWVLLAAAVYPFLLACAWVYLRRAERNERVFTAMVAPAPGPPPEPADEP